MHLNNSHLICLNRHQQIYIDHPDEQCSCHLRSDSDVVICPCKFDEDCCKGGCRPWDTWIVASTMPFSPYMVGSGHFQLPEINVCCIPPELVIWLRIASLDFCLTMFDLFLFLQVNPYVVASWDLQTCFFTATSIVYIYVCHIYIHTHIIHMCVYIGIPEGDGEREREIIRQYIYT